MSALKAGRPTKKVNASIKFEMHQFANTLLRIGGNAEKWSLNKEWLAFYKMHFNTTYAKHKHARASYDFFKKHHNALVSIKTTHTPSLENTVSPSISSTGIVSKKPRDANTTDIGESITLGGVREPGENWGVFDAEDNLHCVVGNCNEPITTPVSPTVTSKILHDPITEKDIALCPSSMYDDQPSFKTTPDPSGGVQSPDMTSGLITFPKLERVENSIFIINSDSISLSKELDRLASVPSVVKASPDDANL